MNYIVFLKHVGIPGSVRWFTGNFTQFLDISALKCDNQSIKLRATESVLFLEAQCI